MQPILFLLPMIVASLLNGAQKKTANAKEGQIHVSINVISKRGVEPLTKPVDFKFAGEMLIEPISRIYVTEIGGKQTQEYKRDGYIVIDTKKKQYYKFDTLFCGARPSKSGQLRSKSEGMLFDEQMDLFEGDHVITTLPDSLVEGVSYKRFQVKTIDPATKKDIRVIAYALAGKSSLPISLSGTVENKYHCSISFLDVHFSAFDGFVRKSYKYVPYQLSDVERKVLHCFKN